MQTQCQSNRVLRRALRLQYILYDNFSYPAVRLTGALSPHAEYPGQDVCSVGCVTSLAPPFTVSREEICTTFSVNLENFFFMFV